MSRPSDTLPVRENAREIIGEIRSKPIGIADFRDAGAVGKGIRALRPDGRRPLDAPIIHRFRLDGQATETDGQTRHADRQD